MALHSNLTRLAATVEMLDLQDLNGIQMLDGAALLEAHFPPLNPDWPALLFADPALDLAHVQRVLTNQYDPAHDLQMVRITEGDSLEVVLLTVGSLATAAAAGWIALYIPALEQPSSFECFQEIIAHLRAPEGCPWDRKQTHRTLRPYLLEETYEVLEALDNDDVEALREELGDLLLQILLHSQIAVEAGEFRMADVLAGIIDKIVRRHPHVWGEVNVDDDQDVKVNWDRLKQKEKNHERKSRLDGVSKALPALSQAWSYQDRAARVGFDWETIQPVIDKIHEEFAEVMDAPEGEARAGEVGDLLFAVVNLARWLNVDPEAALRGTNTRFYRRFAYIEAQAAAQSRELDEMALDEMDTLWDEAKRNGL